MLLRRPSAAALAAASAVAIGLLAMAAPAQSAFPGANGKIAFHTLRDGTGFPEIYAMNADGTSPTNLSNNVATDQAPAWSADGTKLAFTAFRDGNGEIYAMNADGSGQTRLTNNGAVDFAPTWSPDGTKIAFYTDRDGNEEIYAMNADGTGQTNVTNNAAQDRDPSWSPDGTKIAFATNRDPGLHEIYSMNADGTAPTRLTNALQADFEPTWSPDGAKIAFTAFRDGNAEIYSMNADGTGQTNLTNNEAGDREPAWSPDGAKIAFRTDRDTNGEIYAMNADGTAQTNLSNHTTEDGEPDWQPVITPYTAPKSASPLHVPLVPVFRECSAAAGNPPNTTHGPPQALSACTPPQHLAGSVARVGPQFEGDAQITVLVGDPQTPADEADDIFTGGLTDVQDAGGADYDPSASGSDLTLLTRWRITDTFNGLAQTEGGTVVDFDFSVPFKCTATANPNVGSNCNIAATADTLTPGAIKEGDEQVVQVFRVRVSDAGADNTAGNSDDRLFLQQGVFNP
jgi:Tol biopolymer transport system component